MIIPSEIKFKNKKLKKSFYNLENGDDAEKRLFHALYSTFQKIKLNAFSGIRIPKRLIPKEYNVDNLWKYNLHDGWRLLYSVEAEEIIVVSIVLEWLTHKEYENRFKF